MITNTTHVLILMINLTYTFLKIFSQNSFNVPNYPSLEKTVNYPSL